MYSVTRFDWPTEPGFTHSYLGPHSDVTMRNMVARCKLYAPG